MPTCGGCPEYERRIEIYTDSERGCGDEFYVPPTEPEPEPTDPTDPNPSGGDGGTTPTSGKYIASSVAAIASVAMLY